MNRTLPGWIDPRVEIKESPIQGRGMFACERIRAGERVIVWGGTQFTCDEIRAGLARPHSIAAIDEDLYLADPADAGDSPDYFLNHSCDPNLWMSDAVTLVARRDIEPGEELTADYALWEDDENWTMPGACRCGSPGCRRVITGRDWRLPELERYKGHFSPFLNRRIEKLNGS